MMINTETSSYTPGKSTTSINWLCVDDRTGDQKPINLKVILVAGLIHSLILFVALVVVLQVDKQLGKGQPATRSPSRDAGFTQRDRVQRLCAKAARFKRIAQR